MKNTIWHSYLKESDGLYSHLDGYRVYDHIIAWIEDIEDTEYSREHKLACLKTLRIYNTLPNLSWHQARGLHYVHTQNFDYPDEDE